MNRRLAFVLATLLSLAACASHSPVMLVDRDSSVVMPAAGTYAWAKGQDVIAGEAATPVTPEVHAALQAAVDRAMQARGYKLVPVTDAAFLVHFHVGVVAGKRVEEKSLPASGPVVVCAVRECKDTFAWGYYGAPEVTTRLVSYREGTLLVDVEERLSQRIAYRAAATSDLRKHPRLDPVELDKVLSELFAQLPEAR